MLRWQPSLRKRRRFALLGLVAALLGFLLVFQHHHHRHRMTAHMHAMTAAEGSVNPLVFQQAGFWRSLHELIVKNHPRCHKKPDLVVPRNLHVLYSPDYDRHRPDILWMDDADIERMKAAHSNFLADIRALSTNLVFHPGTRGIITTASEPMLAVLSVSLLMLRRTECRLPVEIFLAHPTPYTTTFCSEVFPSLDASCRYVSDVFTAADTPVQLTTYQHKIFSILFSSFEDILFLDSDAWPISNPEPLFHSLPFTDTGLILWPDFWYASESPYFFDIAKIPASKIPTLSARATTESGEMLYSKPRHNLSLMLATYYNYYGPDYYYLLLSQGGPGQGDKESFPWAATALDEPLYHVKHPVGSFGRHDSSAGYVGSAMIQHDPVADFFTATTRKERSRSPPGWHPDETPHAETTRTQLSSAVKPLFVHANHPKFDPATIFEPHVGGIRSPVRDSNGKYVRAWMSGSESVALFGFDVEQRFWRAMEEMACGTLLGLWLGGGRPREGELEAVQRRDERMCERVKGYITEVFGEGD